MLATLPVIPADFDDLKDIRDLIALGWSHQRIQRAMRIPRATYYRRLGELRSVEAMADDRPAPAAAG